MNVFSTPLARSPPFPYSRRAAIAFLAFATAPTFSPTTAAPQASTLVTLAKIREAWVRDLRAKQLEAILKFYASDAVFLQPTGERITGSTALRTLFQTIMATFDSNLTLHSQNLETSGDLAYDSGNFQETHHRQRRQDRYQRQLHNHLQTPAQRQLANRSASLDRYAATWHIRL